jgi:hypothetical protein
MTQITPAILSKISQPCSGHAMKIAIDNATPEDISKMLDTLGVAHRVLDTQNPTVFDDKGPTIVAGMEDLNPTALTCFLSQMDGLRFRNILFFPKQKWFESEDGEPSFWDRIGGVLRNKFSNRVTSIEIEGL